MITNVSFIFVDIFIRQILAQIENQCRRPKRQRLSEQPLHEIGNFIMVSLCIVFIAYPMIFIV